MYSLQWFIARVALLPYICSLKLWLSAIPRLPNIAVPRIEMYSRVLIYSHFKARPILNHFRHRCIFLGASWLGLVSQELETSEGQIEFGIENLRLTKQIMVQPRVGLLVAKVYFCRYIIVHQFQNKPYCTESRWSVCILWLRVNSDCQQPVKGPHFPLSALRSSYHYA